MTFLKILQNISKDMRISIITKYTQELTLSVMAIGILGLIVTTGTTIRQADKESILTIKVEDRVADIDWHPSEPILAAAIKHKIFLFNTNQGTLQDDFWSSGFVDVKTIHWSPAGSNLAILGNTIRNQVYANELVVWDTAQSIELYQISGMSITSFAWNPTGSLFAITATYDDGEDHVMQVIDSQSGEALITLNVYQLLGSPSIDGTSNAAVIWTDPDTLINVYQKGYVVRISFRGTIEQEGFYGLGQDESLWLGGEGKVDHSLSLNSITSQLAITGFHNPNHYSIWIWDLPTANLETIIEDHTGPIKTIQWSPNGSYLASGSTDGSVRIWSSDKFDNIFILEHDDVVTSLSWSPDSQYLASGSWDSTIRIWDIPTGSDK